MKLHAPAVAGGGFFCTLRNRPKLAARRYTELTAFLLPAIDVNPVKCSIAVKPASEMAATRN
jgi:hypothetical protein